MKIPKLRWVLAGMLCLATMINYVDRQALGVVSVDIRREFGLTEQDYAHIVTVFMAAYAIMYAGSGYLVDKLGTRLGFAFFIAAWSAAQILHAFTRGKWSLAACRFGLGLAEPGNWPAAAKAVSEWFPPEQRALGIGIFNAGSSLGSALSLPLIGGLTLAYGWRAAFVISGALGIVWLVAWLILYQPPHKNRFLKPEEYAELKGRVRPPEEAEAMKGSRINWAVVRMRGCYALIIARFFTDPVIYFMIFWLPEYLRKERGFDLAMVAKYAWVPYIFGDIGYVLGGWLSGHLMMRGWPLAKARKTVMLMGAAVMPAAIFAPLVPEAWMAIGATCFVTFGHALWVANLQTLPTDLFRGTEVGTTTGFSGTGGAIGGMLAALGTGYLVQNFSYTPVFLIAGLMHPLSIVIIYLLLTDRYFNERQRAVAIS